MPISIHIDIHPEHGPATDQLREAMAALGFAPKVHNDARQPFSLTDEEKKLSAIDEGYDPDREDASGNTPFDRQVDEPVVAKPTRERGKPSPGHTRRTKAEIAQDEAAATNVSIASMTTLPADATPAEVAEAFAGVVSGAAAISTGDERVGPEDDAETVEQDEADEAAETAAAREPGVATHDDLRMALGRYQKKHGMPAAVAAVQAGGLIGSTVDKVDAAMLPAMIAKVDAATDGKTEAATVVEKAATKQDLIDAMLKYAAKFDGQTTDMTKMPATMADCPKVFQMLFGEGVVSVTKIPADGYAKAVAGVAEMLAKNPFQRTKVA